MSARPVAWWRVLIAAALASLLAGAALAPVFAGGPSSLSAAPAAPAPQNWLSRLPPAAADPVSRALGANDPAYLITPIRTGFLAASPAQHLHIRFYRSHVALSSGGLEVGLGLRAVGYGESLRAVAPATPRVSANRVSYPHAGLSEWYVNGPLGLEQGFTLRRAPATRASGALTLALALSGDARGHLAPGGQSISFVHAGTPSLRYGGLVANDATGRVLHSWLELRAGRVLLRVGARGARYPLRIDPIFQRSEMLGAAGEEGEGQLGISIALSADGSTALIGAPHDHNDKGAAWVFTRSGSTWIQQGPKLTVGAGGSGTIEGSEAQCVEEAGEEPGECAFGASVALSADGNTALIGDPSATARQGTAWVFTRSGATWTESSTLAGGEGGDEGRFGKSVALSADGGTALIGDPSAAEQAGKAWVFTRSGSSWTAQGQALLGAEASRFDYFGRSVALSGDGRTALVGAPGASGHVGAAWMFTRSGSTWTQQGAKLTGAEEGGEGRFGFSVALSADAGTALIGARHDSEGVGAAWVYTSSGSSWIQQGPKLTGAGESGAGSFGWSVALSPDGGTALIGAPHESHYLGAVRVFTRSGSAWTEQPEELAGPSTSGSGASGFSVALSGDGSALIGIPRESHKAGAVWAFTGAPVPPPVPPVSQTPPNEVVTSPPASGGETAGNLLGSSGVLASQTLVLPPPKLALTGNLTPISGVVLVKLPGSSMFVALTTVRQVPFGTIVNAINGRVSVTTVGPHGGLQTVTFFGGEFRLTQGRNGVVVATLFGGDFSVCPTARERSHLARTSSKHASGKHVVRKLWAEGHGSYSTKGNYATGAVLGTRWLTEDRCDGTLIRVATDRVLVRNLVNHRRVTVKAGHSYLARAR